MNPQKVVPCSLIDESGRMEKYGNNIKSRQLIAA